MPILPKPQWLQHLRELHATAAFGALGGEILDVDDQTLQLRLPMTPATLTPFGNLHGGISAFLAETAASTHACWGIDMAEKLPLGIELNASHVSAAQEGHLLATARLISRTRKLAVHEVAITLEETGQLLSKARVTNYYRNLTNRQ